MNAEFTKAVAEIKALSELVGTADMVAWELARRAMDAVGDAEDTQARLLREIDCLTEMLARARRDVAETDRTFNSCGIIQSRGTAVDLLVGELAARTKEVGRWRWTLKRTLPAELVAQVMGE